MGEQERVGAADPREPVSCARCPCSEPLVLVTAPSDLVGVYPPQGSAQGRGAAAEVVEIRGGVISGQCNEPDSAVRRRGRLHHGEA